MTAEEIFLMLAADATRDGMSKYRRVVPESPFDVRLEVAYPSSNRRLTVQTNTAPDSKAIRQTRGFATAYAPDDQLFRVELQDTRLSPLFSALVDNFLSALLEADPSADSASVLLDRMSLWRRLFEEMAFDGLSPDAQRGLFAELQFMSEMLLTTLAPTLAVSAWKAPTRTSKDFAHNSVAIEVKSRLKKGPSKVRISSENQLDEAGHNLFLAVIVLDPESGGGESLPELVKRLRMQLAVSGVAMTTFDDQLIRAGYLDIHCQHYEGTRYVPSTALFRIAPGFPRVVPSDLPPGVSHINYDLDLISAASFAVGPTVLTDALREEHV